jgi:subtilisin-like proprotein convertase family protein
MTVRLNQFRCLRLTLSAALAFFLQAGSLTAQITNAGAAVAAENCAPANGVLDPGEIVTVNFSLRNAGGPATTNLTATLLASGGVRVPDGPQNYGSLMPGGSTVARPFRFIASGTCGGTLTATLELRDGTANFGTVAFTLPLGVITTNTAFFTNATTIQIPEMGPSSPYPSTINVAGVAGTVVKVTATLHGFGHKIPRDVDILLAGPAGQKSILMSDAGGTFSVSDLTLTFDAAQPGLPATGPLVSGTYAPRDYSTFLPDPFPAPAPAGPYTASLPLFDGTNPNGAWRLFVMDDTDIDEGEITGGWSLALTVRQAACCNAPPVLDIMRAGTNVVLRWPASAAGYVLEAKGILNPALAWANVTNSVVTVNGTNSVSVPLTNDNRFFRLKQ